MYFLTAHPFASSGKAHKAIITIAQRLDNVLVDQYSLDRIVELLEQELRLINKHKHKHKMIRVQIRETESKRIIELDGSAVIYVRPVRSSIYFHPEHRLTSEFFHPKNQI